MSVRKGSKIRANIDASWAVKRTRKHGSSCFIRIKDAVHLQYLRGMQSSDLPGILLTRYHFSVDGI